MRANLRRALLFAVAFLPLFGVLLWLYPRVLPTYERSILLVANPVLARFDPPLVVDVEPDGALFAYFLQPDGSRKPWFDRPYDAYVIFISIVLLPALLGATPVGLLGRLRLLGYGVVLLYVVHVVTLVVLFQVYYCVGRQPDHTLCLWAKGLLLTSGQITSVAGWGLLTWSYWLPGRPPISTEPVSRNAPCPCGSGRKHKRCCGT